MHAFWAIILIILAFTGLYWMYQVGWLEPMTGAISAITTGFKESYGDTATAGSVSASYQAVRIRFVSLGGADNVPQEIDLAAKPKNGGVNVTGWTVRTDKTTVKLPKVRNRYSNSTPDAALEDIFLRVGDRISVYSGEPPKDLENERVTQSEYHVWAGKTILSVPHGTVTLRDEKGKIVDEYKY